MTTRPPSEPPLKNVLVLVRHGESEWNRLNRFTGWKDVDLSEEGTAEAHRAGGMLATEGHHFDVAFTSTLKRAHNTLEIILGELHQEHLPIIKDAALIERDYGILVGLNKDEARERDATHLLTYSALRIEDIAMRLGYQNTANFTRAFRKWMGCTPSIWRVNQRSGAKAIKA